MKFLQHKKKSLKDQIPIVIFMIFSHLWHTHLLLHHFTLQWRKWLPKMMGFNSEFFWFYNHFILFFQQRVSHIHIFLYEPEYTIRNFLHLFLRLIELLTQFCYIIDNWCWWYVMGKKSLFCFAAFQPENKSKVSPENFCLSRRVRICD